MFLVFVLGLMNVCVVLGVCRGLYVRLGYFVTFMKFVRGGVYLLVLTLGFRFCWLGGLRLGNAGDTSGFMVC